MKPLIMFAICGSIVPLATPKLTRSLIAFSGFFHEFFHEFTKTLLRLLAAVQFSSLLRVSNIAA